MQAPETPADLKKDAKHRLQTGGRIFALANRRRERGFPNPPAHEMCKRRPGMAASFADQGQASHRLAVPRAMNRRERAKRSRGLQARSKTPDSGTAPFAKMVTMRENPPALVPVLPSAEMALVFPRAGFSNLQSPIPVECLSFHAFLTGGETDRRPRKPDLPSSSGGGASWIVPTWWSSFPQAVAKFHPGTNKPVCRFHSGRH